MLDRGHKAAGSRPAMMFFFLLVILIKTRLIGLKK
jgi:hypothetical protein